MLHKSQLNVKRAKWEKQVFLGQLLPLLFFTSTDFHFIAICVVIAKPKRRCFPSMQETALYNKSNKSFSAKCLTVVI